MRGREIALAALHRERVAKPCINYCWMTVPQRRNCDPGDEIDDSASINGEEKRALGTLYLQSDGSIARLSYETFERILDRHGPRCFDPKIYRGPPECTEISIEWAYTSNTFLNRSARCKDEIF